MRTGEDEGQGESAQAECPGDAAGQREQGRLGGRAQRIRPPEGSRERHSEETRTGLQGCPSKGHRLSGFSH